MFLLQSFISLTFAFAPSPWRDRSGRLPKPDLIGTSIRLSGLVRITPLSRDLEPVSSIEPGIHEQAYIVAIYCYRSQDAPVTVLLLRIKNDSPAIDQLVERDARLASKFLICFGCINATNPNANFIVGGNHLQGVTINHTVNSTVDDFGMNGRTDTGRQSRRT